MKNKSILHQFMISAGVVILLLAMLNPLTSFDSSSVSAETSTVVNPYHVWVPFGNGVNIYISKIYVDGTDIYVSGSFVDIGGVPGATGIARWDGSAWHALGTGLNSAPSAIIRVGAWLYAGGSFTDAGGDPAADNIARWDGSNWSSLGGNNINSMVFSFTTDGTNLYVGGQFTASPGIPQGNAVAVWNGSSWAALGNGLLSSVRSLAFYNSKLHAAGGWPGLSMFDGLAWNPITGLSGTYNVYLVPIGTDLFVGGDFLAAGSVAGADHIARWDGSNWYALGSGLNGDVYSMTSYGSDLIVSGNFTDAAGNPTADEIARWDGSAWHDMGGGMTSFIIASAGWGTTCIPVATLKTPMEIQPRIT